MRLLMLILVSSLLGSGCASHHSAPTAAQISKKRADAEALEAELVVNIRALDRLENNKAMDTSDYPLETQERELDRRILTIRKAIEEVKAELTRMKDRYNGPY